MRTECAQLGVSGRKDSECGEAFAHLLAQMPHPFWGDFKEPLSQKGFIELLSFGTFPLQKQRKVESPEAKESA